MRMTAFFLLGVALQVSAGTMSQNITFHGREEGLQEAFRAVEAQTDYVVFYSKSMLELAHPVKMDVKNMPLKQFLDSLLSNQPLKYVIENKSILISRRPAISMETGGNAIAPAYILVRITGTITDSTGHGLAGATVAIKGTEVSTVTDADGRYAINASPGDILVVSYIGYGKTEIKVGQDAVLNIMLKQSVRAMQELAIVNTGYQRLSRRELASAVTVVKMEEIELDSRFSVDQMLAGKVPGLMSLQTSGEPGATPKIRIRGTSSLIGGSAPLWVLDDIILENPVNVDLSNLNSPDAQYLVGNAIAGVNARDIETITVLKDASATAIYGSRAANGVIVVTTKRGRVGKPQINYSGSVSLNQRVSYGDLDLMNAGERVQLSQDILTENIEYSRVPRRLGYEGLYLGYLDKELSYDEFKTGVQKMVDRNTDWYDILFRNSVSSNHSVNVSGGSDRTTYYASLGYSDMPGSAKGSDQKRYSGMVKINTWKSDRFFAGLQINASNSKGNGFFNTVNPNRYAYETARTIPAYNDDGTPFFYLTEQKSQEFAANAAPKEDMMYSIINETAYTGSNSDVTSLTAQLRLEYRFLKNFRYRFLGGFDQGLTNTSSWAEEKSNYVSTIRLWNPGVLVPGTPDFDKSVIPWGGVISNSDQRKNSYTVRNSIEYSKVFGEDNLVNAMATQEIRSLRYKGMAGTYYGWQPERGNTISPAITAGYLGIVQNLRPVITDNYSNNLSWLGTATYSYRDKITINGNIRADGSNNFGDNPKYRFLPVWSVAGKYTFSNEPFLRQSDILSYLAVRGSYGVQGNIDKATSPDLIIQVGARDGTTGLNESYFKYLANPDLRWEKTNSYNLGVEFAFFSRPDPVMLDVISGTIDFYAKKGTDIIVIRRVSQVIGLDQVKVNGGKVNNSGVEGSVRIVPYQTRNFTASLTVVASYNKNVLVEANRELNNTDANKLAGNAHVEGKPIGSFYSYPFAGLNEESGYPMFYSSKGDPRYELYPADIELVYSGVNTPDVSGGFDLSLRYKGWYASMDFQYAVGGVSRLPNFYRSNYYAVFDALANASKELNTRWRKPGDEARTNIPVLYDGDKYKAAKDALNAPIQITGGGSAQTPLSMYDRSDLRTAKTDNLRLRSINLNYVVQPKVLQRMGLESLTVNFQTENLLLFADNAWLGRDPESGGSNTPLPKVYTLGLNVGF